MANYGNMVSRIADEIKRSSLTTNIKAAIQTAIKAYESRPFYFNQQRATMPTVANHKIYGLADDFKKMRTLRINYAGTSFSDLDEINLDEVNECYPNDAQTGTPEDYYIDWAENKPSGASNRVTIGQLWLLPAPARVWIIDMSYFRELGVLSQDADENAWTNEGEVLIRARAKRELYTHVIRDVNEALKFAAAEDDARKDLQRANNIRRAPGRIRGNW